ncbi:GNAT family N-acetyltransferase [Pseudonocardia sichuanensis]
MANSSEIVGAALTERTWADFEQVMGPDGGARGCWCMHWRMTYQQWERGRGAGNRATMRERAESDPPPGVVCYLDGEPVGWVAIGERSEYPRMQRSPVTKAIDQAPVWVISCVYVRRDHRGAGLHAPLIDAACRFAADQGQEIVEAVPVEPAGGKRAGADTAMTGMASAYLAAGFREVARRKSDRPVMRRTLRPVERPVLVTDRR